MSPKLREILTKVSDHFIVSVIIVALSAVAAYIVDEIGSDAIIGHLRGLFDVVASTQRGYSGIERAVAVLLLIKCVLNMSEILKRIPMDSDQLSLRQKLTAFVFEPIAVLIVFATGLAITAGCSLFVNLTESL